MWPKRSKISKRFTEHLLRFKMTLKKQWEFETILRKFLLEPQDSRNLFNSDTLLQLKAIKKDRD